MIRRLQLTRADLTWPYDISCTKNTTICDAFIINEAVASFASRTYLVQFSAPFGASNLLLSVKSRSDHKKVTCFDSRSPSLSV